MVTGHLDRPGWRAISRSKHQVEFDTMSSQTFVSAGAEQRLAGVPAESNLRRVGMLGDAEWSADFYWQIFTAGQKLGRHEAEG